MNPSTPSTVPQDFLDQLYAIPGNKVALRYLIEQLNGEGVIVFAGAGVSVATGFPLWEDFVRGVASGAAWNPGPVEAIVDHIVAKAGRMFFLDEVEEAYGYTEQSPEASGMVALLPFSRCRR